MAQKAGLAATMAPRGIGHDDAVAGGLEDLGRHAPGVPAAAGLAALEGRVGLHERAGGPGGVVVGRQSHPLLNRRPLAPPFAATGRTRRAK